MEPHATLARWDAERLTSGRQPQAISGTQQTLAAAFGLAPSDVRVICPYVGGGFAARAIPAPDDPCGDGGEGGRTAG